MHGVAIKITIKRIHVAVTLNNEMSCLSIKGKENPL